MRVLRSREIHSPKSEIEPVKQPANDIEPATPAQNRVDIRRSARLVSNSSPVLSGGDAAAVNDANRKRKLDVGEDLLSPGVENGEGVLNLRSGKKVIKAIGEIDGDSSVNGNGKGKGKGKDKMDFEEVRVSRETSKEVVDLEKLEIEKNADRSCSEKRTKRFSKGEKGKEKMDFEEVTASRLVGKEGVDLEKLEIEKNADGSCSEKRPRRFCIEEKGKAKMVDIDLNVDLNVFVDVGLEVGSKHAEGNVVRESGVRINEPQMEQTADRRRSSRVGEWRKEQFRDIARQNASRFAYFNGDENHLSLDNERQVEAGEVEEEIEDWPGPFSTAMKIVRDREKKLREQQGTSIFLRCEKSNTSISWIPKKGHPQGPKLIIPSLKKLSLKVLVQNAGAITSLEHVPDALRHELSFMLCDSRGMNSHFLNLLVDGSPTEIRLRDCSWLTEEEFTKAFDSCDTKNLTVLQLDRCGRCLPDYIMLSTLARSPNSLPSLTTLSLSGACRLSDVGFKALVSSTPALRCINLSQCSLLTPTSMDILADKLGSFIQELYITDCQSLDAMLILPALKKLKHLEVMSVARIETVTDEFVKEFVYACGHNMKELVLTDCVKLTDFSLKVIAETCPRLCTLDISNLYKLTDFGIGYLANGCRAIQTLKLSRNAFSDEAVAAFLETSGERLKELSLNNVKKVACNTALSITKRSNKLVSLDLSWCRNMSDEAVGLIVDSCLSLRMLKLFGCTQITNAFLDGHSNPDIQIIGLKMSPVLEHIKLPDFQEGPLHYSSVLSSM